MNFKDIANRFTGFSFPFFGVSWNPSETDRQIARRVLAYLDDRRVLYSPFELEVPRHCVESIIEIRQFLTQEIEKLDFESDLSTTLRGMRAACRKFLDNIQPIAHEIQKPLSQISMLSTFNFFPSLGELRGVLGVHIAGLVTKYGLQIEEGLSKILPVEPQNRNEQFPE